MYPWKTSAIGPITNSFHVTLLIYPQMHSWAAAVKVSRQIKGALRSQIRWKVKLYMTENNCGSNNKWPILCFDGNLPMAANSGVLKRMRQQAGHHHFKMRFTHQLEPLVQILETNHFKPMKPTWLNVYVIFFYSMHNFIIMLFYHTLPVVSVFRVRYQRYLQR